MSLAARPHLTLLFLSASLAASLVACSRQNEAVTGAHSATTEQEPDFEPNNVLDDASMADTGMTAGDVQAFLDRTPYGKRSVLATYKPTTTRTAAQVIVDTAVRYEINPMLLLVRAQLENGLVSKTTATEAVLARAFGCGCSAATSGTDAGSSSAVCSPTTPSRGFENQASCAASQLRTSLDRLTGKTKAARRTTDGTAKGWAANERHTTRDGIEVIPDNDATAVLYAYKPWVGKLGNGDPDVGGMSAHARLWRDFTASTGTTSDAGVDVASRAPTQPPTPTPTTSCGTGCSGGSVCDEPTGKCVECAGSDTSNCQADGLGAACIAGRCGCENHRRLRRRPGPYLQSLARRLPGRSRAGPHRSAGARAERSGLRPASGDDDDDGAHERHGRPSARRPHDEPDPGPPGCVGLVERRWKAGPGRQDRGARLRKWRVHDRTRGCACRERGAGRVGLAIRARPLPGAAPPAPVGEILLLRSLARLRRTRIWATMAP